MNRRRARIASATAAALGSAALASSAALGNILSTAAPASAQDSSAPGARTSVVTNIGAQPQAGPVGAAPVQKVQAPDGLEEIATAEQVTLTVESATFSAADAYSPSLQTKLDAFHDRIGDALTTIHRINPGADVQVAPFSPLTDVTGDNTVQTNADTVAGVVNALLADIAADHDASVAA